MPRQRKRLRLEGSGRSRSPIMTRSKRIRSRSPGQRIWSRSPIMTREKSRAEYPSPIFPPSEIFPRGGNPCKSPTPPPTQPASDFVPSLLQSPSPPPRHSASDFVPSPLQSPSPPQPQLASDFVPLLLQPGYMRKFEKIIRELDNLRKPLSGDDDFYKQEENSLKRDRLLDLTEGFYAGKWKFDDLNPAPDDISGHSPDNYRAIEAATRAISRLPEEEGEKLKFVEIVRVNAAYSSGFVFYLTIKASNNKFYEAKVYDNLTDNKVEFIRPACHYPNVDPDFLKFDAPGSPES